MLNDIKNHDLARQGLHSPQEHVRSIQANNYEKRRFMNQSEKFASRLQQINETPAEYDLTT